MDVKMMMSTYTYAVEKQLFICLIYFGRKWTRDDDDDDEYIYLCCREAAVHLLD